MGLSSHHILNFSQIDLVDSDLICKKAKMLGELRSLNIPIPDGFVITSLFFNEFLQKTGILPEIENIKNSTHPALCDSLPKLLEPICKKVMLTHIPQHLTIKLHSFYRKLAGVFKEPLLNIYSSARKNKSMTFYNIKGDANLILKIKTLLAYYLDQSFSVVVQKAVSKDKKSIVTDDTSIDNQNLLKLAKKIQNYFYFPQKIEYVVEKSKIYVTDVKPFTPHHNVVGAGFTGVVDERQRKILIKGVSVNPGIVTGHVRLINNQNFVNVKNSEIVVTKNLNKSLYNKIKKAKAVVTDAVLQRHIDKLYYRKIIKAPTITGCENAAKLLHNGNIITVNGVTGEIYSGGFM